MHRHLFAGLTLLVMLLPGAARPADVEYYKSKTITIVCGYGVGGGYDLYARLLSRHLGNYIPGKPAIIVQTMTGAGGMRAGNYVYSTAPKDGMVIAATNPSLLMYQLLGGTQARYETAKLQWIGSLDEPNNSIITWHTSGIRTIDDAKARDVPVPGDGPTSSMSIYPTAANALLGTRFKIIDGYPGSASGDLAMERGEVDGRSGASLSSLFAQHSNWIRDRKINILLQFGAKRAAKIPDVPLLQDLLPNERDRQIAGAVSLPTTVGPAYWMAPGVPEEALRLVRKAFDTMIADPQLHADARQLKLDILPKTGEQVQAAVNAVAHYPQDVLAQTGTILKW